LRTLIGAWKKCAAVGIYIDILDSLDLRKPRRRHGTKAYIVQAGDLLDSKANLFPKDNQDIKPVSARVKDEKIDRKASAANSVVRHNGNQPRSFR